MESKEEEVTDLQFAPSRTVGQLDSRTEVVGTVDPPLAVGT